MDSRLEIVQIFRALTISYAQITELESSFDRPTWVLPTFVREVDPGEPSKIALFVPALYWGVHRMLRDLFRDGSQAAEAEAFASALLRL